MQTAQRSGRSGRSRKDGAGSAGDAGGRRSASAPPGSLHEHGGLSSPRARRLRSPGWRDPRLLLGIVLVAGSVALGSGLVAAAGRTAPVYAARGALVPGDALDEAALVVREVRIDPGVHPYLDAAQAPPEGLVVVRTVGEGELVPLAALATADGLDVRPVAIATSTPLSRGVTTGSLVDLWFVPALDGAPAATAEQTTQPVQLVAGLTVAEVTTPEGAFTVASSSTVHVLVPVDQLATVLAALGGTGSVEVVHVPGGSGR